MFKHPSPIRPRTALFPVMAVVMGISLMGCETTEELRQMNLAEDEDTCVSIGAPYGSREYTRCMLAQQERRDRQVLDNQASALMNAEQARTNVETLARIRCEREARQDREAGRRPRRCD